MRGALLQRIVFVLLCVVWLTGCGFHLRDAVTLAPPLRQMYLQTADPYGELARNLRQGLQTDGVYWTATPATATTILEIVDENTTQQLLSVGGTQQTRQYNLLLSVTFKLTTPAGKILLAPQTVLETQALTVQASQILGGSNEQNNLYNQMRQDIVATLLNRIAAPTVTANLQPTVP